MPLNSYTCSNCGKRNNYVVEFDADGIQSMICPICGAETVIEKSQIPDRILESIQELDEANNSLGDGAQITILNDDESIVDKLLANMEATFQDVKENFNIDGEGAKMDMDIAKIAEDYAPIKGTVDEKSEKLVQDMMGKSSTNEGWKRDAVAAAANKAAEYVPEEQLGGRVLRYLSNSLASGMGIDEILDVNNMKASDLSKKERFILTQLARSEQLNDILSRYLGGESF